MEPDQFNGKDIRQHSLRLAIKKHILSKKLFLISLAGLVVVGLLIGWYRVASHTSLVPEKIQKQVQFPIYYPETVPAGYTLDTNSFHLPEPGVVIFAVTHGKGVDIVFSEEQQPSGNEIDKFVTSYIPLNSPLQLPLGQAKIGAYGKAPDIRTVVSLPIHDGPWLIMTAPSAVSHDDEVKILDSLTK